jgi:ATP-dependent protease ClpP protease subunit
MENINIGDNDRKTEKKTEKLNSRYHTLFKIKKPSKRISKGKGLFKEQPAYTIYRIFIDDFMDFERGLHEMFNELYQARKTDRLELRINSYGGLVNEGAQFYNMIKNVFPGRVTTVLDNCGYSMGALTFCMGDKRIVNERADLMFHDYSSGNRGKGGELEARQKHNSKFIRKFFYDVIITQGFLTKKEFKKMTIGQDYWMDVVELCKRGIATHVLVKGEEIKAKKYLKNLDKNGIYQITKPQKRINNDRKNKKRN